MKWYFALSESSIERKDHDWLDLVRVAVSTARSNTKLRPFMIFDGKPCAFTSEMQREGVHIIYHRVSFDDALVSHNPHEWYLPIARGCFLRVDIPILETEDDFVLYTDCDVMFNSDVNLDCAPNLFAACSERRMNVYEDLNSGVMFLNVNTMREQHSDFVRFIRENITIGLDQEMYAAFFRGRYELIDPIFNWKPYWGIKEEHIILHWHGPKPIVASKIIEDPAFVTVPVWKELVLEDPTSYEYYLRLWRVRKDAIDFSSKARSSNSA